MDINNGRVCGIAALFSATIFIVYCKSISNTGSWTWRRQMTLDDALPPDADMTLANKTSTKRQCAMLCLREEWCNSFFYHCSTQQCMLHRMIFITLPNGWSTVPGLRYYRLERASACQSDKSNVIDRLSGTCYRLDLSRKTWVDGYNECASNNESLVVLEPLEKAQFIRDLIMNCRALTADSVYIGAQQLAGVSDFKWINGEAVNISATKSFWATKTDFTRVQPDGVILLRKNQNFQWSIARSDFNIHFICERPFL